MTHVRYVVMANGKGSRWGDHLGIPKQLIEIHGETLLARIARQVAQLDPEAEIIISSSDPRHNTPGARRYAPLRNEIELDRFVEELLIDDTCFLYGDTFYTDTAIRQIIRSGPQPIIFFGDSRSIAGVSCNDAKLMLSHLQKVREYYLSGKLDDCIGWQVYQSYTGQLFQRLKVGSEYRDLSGGVAGFNSPEDLRDFIDSLDQELEYANP